MKKISPKLVLMTLAIFFAAVSWLAAATQVQKIDKDTLKNWLANPQVEIIDVRSFNDWEASALKIKGAVRKDPGQVRTWMQTLPQDKKIVLYCA
jgi:rhodanese-related sulfurtransferase